MPVMKYPFTTNFIAPLKIVRDLFRRLFRARRDIVFILLGLLVAIVVTEAILQVADPTEYNIFKRDLQSDLITYKPGDTFRYSSICVDNEVKINAQGFHGPEIATEKHEGVFRIGVIGSSFVESLQVPQSAMFTTLLEQKLNTLAGSTSYEVVPIAFSANGTYLNMLYYDRFASPYKPDLVINIVTGYELDKNAESAKYPPRFDDKGNLIWRLPPLALDERVQMLKNFGRESKLIMNLQKRLVLVKNFAREQIAHPTLFFKTTEKEEGPQETQLLAKKEEQLWKVEEKLLSIFKDRVEKDGSHFLLVSWQPQSGEQGASTPSLSTHLSSIASKGGFPYYDMAFDVLKSQTLHSVEATWSCDGHWSIAGHTYVADALFEYLTNSETHLIGNI